jgi:hypothetical protein
MLFSVRRVILKEPALHQARTYSLLSGNLAIKYRTLWDFPIRESPRLTNLIQDLANAEIEDLEPAHSRMKAVVLRKSELFTEGEAYAPNVLYIRHRSVY